MEAICKVFKVKATNKESMFAFFSKNIGTGIDTGMLDLSYFTPYTPSIGFRMNLEAISNCNLNDSVIYALGCVNPPASPYNRSEKSMVGAFTVMQLNWQESTNDHFVFAEDDSAVGNMLLFNSSMILFEIKEYNYKTKLSSDYGFVAYPIT